MSFVSPKAAASSCDLSSSKSSLMKFEGKFCPMGWQNFRLGGSRAAISYRRPESSSCSSYLIGRDHSLYNRISIQIDPYRISDRPIDRCASDQSKTARRSLSDTELRSRENPVDRCRRRPGRLRAAATYRGRRNLVWRKRWDSNPRTACTVAGFQDRFLKPLGHSSCHKGTEPCTKRWAGFTAIRGEASTGLRRTAREYGQFHPRFASVLLRQYRIVSSGGQSVRHGTGFGVAKS